MLKLQPYTGGEEPTSLFDRMAMALMWVAGSDEEKYVFYADTDAKLFMQRQAMREPNTLLANTDATEIKEDSFRGVPIRYVETT